MINRRLGWFVVGGGRYIDSDFFSNFSICFAIHISMRVHHSMILPVLINWSKCFFKADFSPQNERKNLFSIVIENTILIIILIIITKFAHLFAKGERLTTSPMIIIVGDNRFILSILDGKFSKLEKQSR